MFDNIFAAIEKWMRELLTGMVESNMSTMFTDVNEKTSEIAAQVGRTPQNWNSSVFSMIQNLSESVVVPIAGIIITLVLCYELISMLTERNNLHDVDTWMFFKYFVKAWVCLLYTSRCVSETGAYLAKHPDDKDSTKKELLQEQAKLVGEIADLKVPLTEVQEDLKKLRDIRYWVRKATPGTEESKEPPKKQPLKEVLQDKADEKKAQKNAPAQTKHKQQDMEL